MGADFLGATDANAVRKQFGGICIATTELNANLIREPALCYVLIQEISTTRRDIGLQVLYNHVLHTCIAVQSRNLQNKTVLVSKRLKTKPKRNSNGAFFSRSKLVAANAFFCLQENRLKMYVTIVCQQRRSRFFSRFLSVCLSVYDIFVKESEQVDETRIAYHSSTGRHVLRVSRWSSLTGLGSPCNKLDTESLLSIQTAVTQISVTIYDLHGAT